jgi:hypothetical protein
MQFLRPKTVLQYFVCINDIHDIFDQSCDPLKLDHSLVSSLSFADDLVIFSESHKGLQNALYKLQKYCFDWQLTVKTVSNALRRSTKQENIFHFFFKTYLDIRAFKINKLSVVL